MYVIAIDTFATIMLPMLKLTDSCVVYTFVNVCNCYCYMYVVVIVTDATIMLPMLKLTNPCVVYTFVHVCNCDCYRCNHSVANAKVNQFMGCVYIRTCM